MWAYDNLCEWTSNKDSCDQVHSGDRPTFIVQYITRETVPQLSGSGSLYNIFEDEIPCRVENGDNEGRPGSSLEVLREQPTHEEKLI